MANPLRTKSYRNFEQRTPLDREAKVRIMAKARALTHATEAHKHYGRITAKTLRVLAALLYDFHNGKSGACFPSYERLAEKAHCNRSTIAAAIGALERCGLLSWCNTWLRQRRQEGATDEMGRPLPRWRILRSANGYVFFDPSPSKSKIPTGTTAQDFKASPAQTLLEPDLKLQGALHRLGLAIQGGAT